MQSMAKITAQGAYVPEKVMDNNDFEKIVDTSDEWIQQRTGIIERRIADEKEYTSDLSYKAVLDLQEKYQVDLTDVDMIINATLTPDYKTPSVASYIQAKLGLENAGAIDINAACAGFTYGLNLANGLITSGQNKKILVIGSETLSKITDYTDRSTCILFGDGAGAFLVEYDEEETSFIASNAGSDGAKGHNLYCSELSGEMFSNDLENPGYIVQNGRGVYKWAVGNVPKIIHEVLNKSDYSVEDLDWFAPHSANARMIESICEKTNIGKDKALMSLKYYGNTSSATIPLSIDLAIKEGKINKDDLILLVGFGGGLAYASTLIKWGI
ncbi:ketoacyl-ACP synthase III [Staphylococcus pasteuri]|uniref:ketoacyl-ACP synthase III n=1 Tax=Staphylococcus pasteuri TaxID=45972 RepID=UPI001E34B426|nr:ketoacyl-ACP synthase III [Staphylococcus pasteuri]MCE3022780.1 ketoacyl-ACP synthase III [Staphylococcus pasteuri]